MSLTVGGKKLCHFQNHRLFLSGKETTLLLNQTWEIVSVVHWFQLLPLDSTISATNTDFQYDPINVSDNRDNSFCCPKDWSWWSCTVGTKTPGIRDRRTERGTLLNCWRSLTVNPIELFGPARIIGFLLPCWHYLSVLSTKGAIWVEGKNKFSKH